MCRRRDHLTALLTAFEDAITVKGFRLEFFRPLDTYKHPIAAMEEGPYRLYGMRYDDELFIAGGGSIKFTRRLNDTPGAKAAHDDVEYAARLLRQRLKRRGLNAPPRDDRGLMHLPDDFLSFN